MEEGRKFQSNSRERGLKRVHVHGCVRSFDLPALWSSWMNTLANGRENGRVER